MRKLLVILLVFCCFSKVFGNAAMPGIWNAGHGAQFFPLFAKDSIYFGKIKMQKERVLINIYPGFAVVKGEYWMYNTTGKSITMTVGYPVNGMYRQEVVDNVTFEDLYNMKVLINGKEVATKKTQNSNLAVKLDDGPFRRNNWYYWNTTFAPHTITKLTVYFITDNSRSHLRKGYNITDGNAFAYILETGRAWGGKIDSGQVLLQLNDGLKLKNIKGILPDSTLRGDDTHLEYTFTNLEPYPKNNILIWYDALQKKEFNINEVLTKGDQYFKEVDNFCLQAFNQASFKTIYKSDFKVKDSASWIFIGIFAAAVLFGFIIISTVIYLLYKLFSRPKRIRYD